MHAASRSAQILARCLAADGDDPLGDVGGPAGGGARALRDGALVVLLSDRVGRAQVVPSAAAPTLLLSPQVAASAERQPGAFRFWVGRALAAYRAGQPILDRVDDEALLDLVAAIGGRRAAARGGEGQQLRRALSRLLSRKERKVLADLLPAPADEPPGWSDYRPAAQAFADRVALALCGDPRVALAELCSARGDALPDALAREPLRSLALRVVSDEHAALCRSLRGQVVGGGGVAPRSDITSDTLSGVRSPSDQRP